MQLCWEICIRWHKKLRMLATKSEQLFIDLKVDEQQKGNRNMVSLSPQFGYQLRKPWMRKLGRVSPLSKWKISTIGLGNNEESGANFWGIPGWGEMQQPKRLLPLMRRGLTWLRYVIFTTLIFCIFVCNFLFHISSILMYILSFQGG